MPCYPFDVDDRQVIISPMSQDEAIGRFCRSQIAIWVPNAETARRVLELCLPYERRFEFPFDIQENITGVHLCIESNGWIYHDIESELGDFVSWGATKPIFPFYLEEGEVFRC